MTLGPKVNALHFFQVKLILNEVKHKKLSSPWVFSHIFPFPLIEN